MSEAQKRGKQAWLDRMKVGASKEIIQGRCTCRLSLLHHLHPTALSRRRRRPRDGWRAVQPNACVEDRGVADGIQTAAPSPAAVGIRSPSGGAQRGRQLQAPPVGEVGAQSMAPDQAPVPAAALLHMLVEPAVRQGPHALSLCTRPGHQLGLPAHRLSRPVGIVQTASPPWADVIQRAIFGGLWQRCHSAATEDEAQGSQQLASRHERGAEAGTAAVDVEGSPMDTVQAAAPPPAWVEWRWSC